MGIRIDCICDRCRKAEILDTIDVKGLDDSDGDQWITLSAYGDFSYRVPSGWGYARDGVDRLIYCDDCTAARTEADRTSGAAALRAEVAELRQQLHCQKAEVAELAKLRSDHDALRRAASAILGSPAELIRLFAEQNMPPAEAAAPAEAATP